MILSPFSNLEEPSYTVGWIISVGLAEMKDKFSEIALKAAKEAELVKMIENVEAVWRGSSLVVTSYKDNKEISILGNNEDLIAKIDDTLLTVNNILASRFVEGIRTRVEAQLKLLRYFQELLDEWMLH
jgi:dynein heavy chain